MPVLHLAACSADGRSDDDRQLSIDVGGSGGQGADARDTSDHESDAPPRETEPGCIDNDGDGYGEGCSLGPDCNDLNPYVNPGMPEVCGDGFDNNCDGQVDEGCPCVEGTSRYCYEGPEGTRNVGACRDGTQTCVDGEWTDCTHVGPTEEICDGIDNNCDGQVDEGVSNACGTCGPVPREICGDFLDNDCNGLIDDDPACNCGGRQGMPCYSGPPGTLGIGICHGGFTVCVDDRFYACVGEQLPEAEVCDGLDNNCDGRIDEGLTNACGDCFADDPVEVCDGIDNNCDGHIDEGLLNLCGECGPIDTPEICGDGLDNNCDGRVDEGCPCYLGDDTCWPGLPEQRNVGQCRDGYRSCDASGEFWGACEGFVAPSVEICDGIDNTCDGQIDIGPNGCSVCFSEEEICDGIDNNCDGQIDEGLRNACGQCIENVIPEEECGPACCDGIDNDCDGLIDEGLLNICGKCNQPCDVMIWGDDPGEWDDGVSEGLREDENRRLRLGAGLGDMPYLWIPNSGEATISKINMVTMREEERYPTGAGPSRTAVDFHGNVFVANRSFFGQGTMTRVNAADCTGLSCVRYTAPVGGNNSVPRGMAIDAEGFPWVGTYNDNSLRRLSPTTGLVIEEYDVGVPIFSMAIDGNGIIWFGSLRIPEYTGGSIGAFDIEEQRVVGRWTIPGCSNPNGITVDGTGTVWVGNFTCNNLIRFVPSTQVFTAFTLPTLDRPRGVTVDTEDMIWVASYGTNRVARFNPATESWMGSYPVCEGPTGIAVSEDGHAWVSCWASDNVYKISYDGTHMGTINVGRDPYGFSDMTGFRLRNLISRRGTWTVQWDCGFDDCIFNEGRWVAAVPTEGAVFMRARSSTDGDRWTSWLGPFQTQPANLNPLPPGRFIEIEIQLRTSNREVSPALQQVEVWWSRP